MKNIDGINYLTIGEVAKQIDRSAQTIKNWYKWKEAALNPRSKELPDFRRDIDKKQTYYFAESVIPELVAFRDDISYGQMSEFSVTRWGERGKEIAERRKDKEDEEAATTVE